VRLRLVVAGDLAPEGSLPTEIVERARFAIRAMLPFETGATGTNFACQAGESWPSCPGQPS